MENQKTTGDFKPSEKFIEFVGAKGNINFISNEALIEGKLLSGLDFEDKTFKLTIYKDGTVDFDDVENQITTKEQRENLLTVITEKTVVPFRKRTVVRELTFTSVDVVDGKKISLYLAVNIDKPIEKLASIFDGEDIEITDSQQSKIDLLMSMFDDEKDLVSQEIENQVDVDNNVGVESSEKSLDDSSFNFNKQLEDSFIKMKQDKIESLKKDLEKKKMDLAKFERDRSFAESKVSEFKAEVRLLESRIDSLQPQADQNGIYFNVSERLNEQIVLEKEIYEIIKSKVSKVKGINSEAFMKLFEDGEFQIRLSKKGESGFEEMKDFKEIENSISDLKLTIKEDKLYYIGEVVWADLVNKFIRLGFMQDPEWNKICNSNSYKITEEII